MNDLDSLIRDAIGLIEESDTIAIASHVQPDGDSIGSILALGMAIGKINSRVKILKTDNIPLDYNFLPNINLIEEYKNEQFDLFIALDCGDIQRLGLGAEIALKSKTILNIDHHVSNDNFGDINIVSPFSAATAELVYKIIKKMGIELDEDIATCLYTGISTDTGRFMHSNTTYITHAIVSDLIKTNNIDINKINMNLYQNKSIEKANLFLNSLKTLETLSDDRIGVATVTMDMLMLSNAKLEDTEGIISFIRDINTVEVACLLKEVSESEVKVSMRSKSEIDVSDICSKFSGGGHMKAAGCTIYDNIGNAKKLILEETMRKLR